MNPNGQAALHSSAALPLVWGFGAGRRPMNTFDPSRPAMLHDCFTDRVMRWHPASCRDYRRHATPHASGTVLWNGRLFDGWSPLM